ncbi:MAG: transketolase [Fidelibacterota bacterium]
MVGYKDLESFNNWTLEEKDQFALNVLKGFVIDGVRKANSGHTGGALSSMDFAYTLFTEYLKFDPDDPEWIARDRFVLSAGHESMLLYSLLFMVGWLGMEDLQSFRQFGSSTPGHPEVDLPGVEATTGPLGQGLAMGIGMSVAESLLRATFLETTEKEDDLVGHFTYILAGDGDLQEPVALGAASLAGHWGLSRLILYYDSNSAQISGSTSRSDSTVYATLFEGFNWHVQKIDGHDLGQIREAIEKAQVVDRPSIIIGKSVMAHGTASMEGDPGTHGTPLPPEEIAATRKKWGLPAEPFFIPAEVVNHFRTRFTSLREEVSQWKLTLKETSKDSRFRKLWKTTFERSVPELHYPEFEAGNSLATRKAFGLILDVFSKQVSNLVGGSADLEPSNYTGNFAATYGDFSRERRTGRNLAFGVREFPMAAILNGIALHDGLIPFGGTFLVFSDYERPALRLAALQKLRVIHEFTHDSFYVGEDGPTHQPVEQIMALRAIPNFQVFRPADARETAVCFKLALESTGTPSALALTRQGVPVLDLSMAQVEAGVARGAYCLHDCDGWPELVFLATGSEVSLALEVMERMNDRRIRVVSMPCWELFDRQPDSYKRKLIPLRGAMTVSLEAGITQGWERYVGPQGLMIGLDHFGASAPAGVLARKYGFTAEKVEKKIRHHLDQLL